MKMFIAGFLSGAISVLFLVLWIEYSSIIGGYSKEELIERYEVELAICESMIRR